jgi:dienelactone hydrolase
VVDVQGRISSGSGYTAISPVRMADTRSPIGVPTADRLQPKQTTALSFPVMSGMPTVVDSAVVNVTATDPLGSGFITVFPCGEPAPLASNLNIVRGDTRPNLVVTRLGADGTICLTSSVPVHVVVDLQGWYAGSAPPPPVSAPERRHVDIAAGLSLGYLAYLPAGYSSSAGRTWPTIVFLHGSGEEGSGVGADLDRVGVNGLPRLFESGTEPAVAAGFVVLAPQLPDGSNVPGRLKQWLSQVLPRYNVDRDRLYLTGLSAGGFGAFDYLGFYGDANEFAAIVPIAGGYTRGIQCANWQHTPLWAFHGEADPNVPISRSIIAVESVNADCAPTEPLRLTTYPGVGHDSWDLTYDLSGMAPGLTNPARNPYDIDVYTWMLGHVRSRMR